VTTAEDELRRERNVKRITDQAFLDAVIERELLRTVVRELVRGADIEIKEAWLHFGAGEFCAPHHLEPEEVAAYQRALDGGET
jgi:hypothetical protein